MNLPESKQLTADVQKEIDRLKKLELENKEVYKYEVPEE